MGAFIFDGLQKMVEVGALPADAVSREVKMKLFSHTMQVEKLCKAQYAKAAELANIYAEHGIRTVVLKGIAVGTCYPNPWHRPCGDLDCFLMGEYEQGNKIVKRLGMAVDEHSYKHSEFGYKGLQVENHQFCTAVSGSRRAKRFERLLQSLLTEEGTTQIGKTYLENPSPMFNALFLAHHALGHFLTEGIALRHLCDWAMLLHKQGDKIDWTQFTKYADEFGLKKFADAMTRLSKAYLGIEFPVNYVPEKDDERDEYLMNEILYSESEKENGSLWQRRLQLIRNIRKNRHRYELFSDVSFMEKSFTLACGYLFDRWPKL